MIEVDWVKSAGHKKAYKHEVQIKIRQKARFEKNYILWKHIGIALYLWLINMFEKNYILWKQKSEKLEFNT